MTAKPSYLGLLNAIASAESQNAHYYAAWAKVTGDAELRRLLELVAVREAEHGLTFEKRVMELGFSVRPRPEPDFDATLAFVGDPGIADGAKFERLGYGRGGPIDRGEDPFGTFFADRTIDIETGALLGRYIAEERDTLTRLCAARERLAAARAA